MTWSPKPCFNILKNKQLPYGNITLKTGCLLYAVGKQLSILLINLGRKWRSKWWWMSQLSNNSNPCNRVKFWISQHTSIWIMDMDWWKNLFDPFANRHAYMRQLFHCLQSYAGSERVNLHDFRVQISLSHNELPFTDRAFLNLGGIVSSYQVPIYLTINSPNGADSSFNKLLLLLSHNQQNHCLISNVKIPGTICIVTLIFRSHESTMPLVGISSLADGQYCHDVLACWRYMM